MAITAALVKELRERTGAGMMECKKALTETAGDIEAAIEGGKVHLGGQRAQDLGLDRDGHAGSAGHRPAQLAQQVIHLGLGQGLGAAAEGEHHDRDQHDEEEETGAAPRMKRGE